MAGIDVPTKGRPRNSTLPMLPFVDLLMVVVAFLLITAVWQHHGQLESNAEVHGQSDCGDCTDEIAPELHVRLEGDDFVLRWKHERTVLSERRIPARSESTGRLIAVEVLAKEIEAQWQARGSHRDPADRKQDVARVYVPNDVPYGELIAVMDAVATPKRELRGSQGTVLVSAFAPVLTIR